MYKQLVHELELIKNMQPDIAKIATMVNSERDVRNILNLIRNYHDQVPLIAIGMGELGIETRINGSELGAYLTYACVNNGKTASPGQISIHAIRRAWGN